MAKVEPLAGHHRSRSDKWAEPATVLRISMRQAQSLR
jgi:hypothetical protein